MRQVQNSRASWRQIWLILTLRCPHWILAGPLTVDAETFRVCIECGARRRFNLDTWLEEGGFYFPAKDKKEQHFGHSNTLER